MEWLQNNSNPAPPDIRQKAFQLRWLGPLGIPFLPQPYLGLAAEYIIMAEQHSEIQACWFLVERHN